MTTNDCEANDDEYQGTSGKWEVASEQVTRNKQHIYCKQTDNPLTLILFFFAFAYCGQF